MMSVHLQPPVRSLRMVSALPKLISLTILLAVIPLGTGCSPAPPQQTDTSNAELDISLGDLGDAWVIEANLGGTLFLAPSNVERQGKIEFLVGPEEPGINLVAAVETHREDIESRPDGVYSGAQELTGPMGTAFYSRGRFKGADGTVEETRLLSIHPRSSRIVEMVYRYPAGDDSSERVGELIELFAEVE